MSTGLLLSYLALWLLVVFQGLVLLGLTRAVHKPPQTGAASVPPNGSPSPAPGMRTGRPMPDFSAVDLSGQTVGSGDFAGQRRVMLFTKPGCLPCSSALDRLDALAAEAGGEVIVVCAAEREPCRRLAEQRGLRTRVLLDPNTTLTTLFGVTATPTAVFVAADDIVGNYRYLGSAEELTQIQSLLQQMVRLAPPPGPPSATTEA
ncbi:MULTISPECIES: TlpA disulfide reductase family protein [unclassified Streptomyces]|uniref:peroxiredoxin family protein n=1 Tax=unclassified Streptomyces TaxID=2593676 RepID=UPI000374CB1D|nr:MULTISPECIES: TlpA disulfide reductase family protein [unclassified Streptomyces]MYT28301.1 redoxin family protein [Streptomyces sp. SID8354]